MLKAHPKSKNGSPKADLKKLRGSLGGFMFSILYIGGLSFGWWGCFT